MPRPCQRRRETVATQRKSKPNSKPAGPPPIRHKARQKAIHNARHGRDHSYRSRHDSRKLDQDDSLEDGELLIDDDSDVQALTINVQVDQVQGLQGLQGEKGTRAEVMFSEREAIAIYRTLEHAGFPLTNSIIERYQHDIHHHQPPLESEPPNQTANVHLSHYSRLAFRSDTAMDSMPSHANTSYSSVSSHISPASSAMSRQPSTSTSTSQASATGPNIYDSARHYKFNWGAHNGKHFLDVPVSYLRTLAGNPSVLDKHPALKDAFDYHRPGMRRTAPTERQLAARQRPRIQTASQGLLQETRLQSVSFGHARKKEARRGARKLPTNYPRYAARYAQLGWAEGGSSRLQCKDWQKRQITMMTRVETSPVFMYAGACTKVCKKRPSIFATPTQIYKPCRYTYHQISRPPHLQNANSRAGEEFERLAGVGASLNSNDLPIKGTRIIIDLVIRDSDMFL
ncbi:hypothetical protein GQ44DRAFT_706535 [Phaeosphaeriaceae sp. PMI808]|nr:hypothetical protein GQ44DRAFT_706535 [Phaeosphaeriaceae sp. PMI808]